MEAAISENNSIIVGIDPGTTTGVALIDLDGNLVLLDSKKNFSREKISRFILNHGSPVIIASDTYPYSRTVEKIAATFSAKIVYPRESLTRKEKNEMVNDYRKKNYSEQVWNNRHEKDALASALFAWNRVEPLMRRVNKKIRLTAKEFDSRIEDDIKRRVIEGQNIRRSIKQFIMEKR